MIELCRLEVELARITTAKTKNKVTRHKDTVENWSSITQIQYLPVSKMCTFARQRNQAQTATVVILLFHISKQNWRDNNWQNL